MSKFERITADDGFIKGELTDGGVVTISDEGWTETDEEKMKGNWEKVTHTIVQDFMNSESPAQDVQVDETVALERDRVVDILSDSSVVDTAKSEEARRRAELLVEHLVEDGVYAQEGESVVILDEFERDSGLYTRLNWTSFLSYVKTELESTVETVERQKETVLDMFDRAGEFGSEQVETDLPSEEELLEDLKRMTGSEWQPRGEDELGYPIPPEGVEEEWEYKMAYNDLMTIQEWKPERVDDSEREKIKGRLKSEIREMERIARQTQKLEDDLRRSSIREISNLPEVQEQIETIKQLSSAIFGGEKSETDVMESTQRLERLADEKGIDLGETSGVETDPTGEVEDAFESDTENRVGEAENVEDMFDSDSQ